MLNSFIVMLATHSRHGYLYKMKQENECPVDDVWAHKKMTEEKVVDIFSWLIMLQAILKLSL